MLKHHKKWDEDDIFILVVRMPKFASGLLMQKSKISRKNKNVVPRIIMMMTDE